MVIYLLNKTAPFAMTNKETKTSHLLILLPSNEANAENPALLDFFASNQRDRQMELDGPPIKGLLQVCAFLRVKLWVRGSRSTTQQHCVSYQDWFRSAVVIWLTGFVNLVRLLFFSGWTSISFVQLDTASLKMRLVANKTWLTVNQNKKQISVQSVLLRQIVSF